MGSYIPGMADKANLERWAKYAENNSYTAQRSISGVNKPGVMQGSEGRMTGRDKSCNCGPIGRYPGSNQDRGGK